MNGTGTLVWENRFGCWDGWSPRDRSILRSMIPIQRRYIDLFAGESWTPLVEKQGDDVFASLWEGSGLRLWTLVNRADKPYSGELLTVSHKQGTHYFDLIRGVEVQAKIEEGLVSLNGQIECILDEYINYYNSKRPHQGINQKVPGRYKTQLYGKVQKLPILGGLHHHYMRSAA
jgi:transposase InsO family protein